MKSLNSSLFTSIPCDFLLEYMEHELSVVEQARSKIAVLMNVHRPINARPEDNQFTEFSSRPRVTKIPYLQAFVLYCDMEKLLAERDFELLACHMSKRRFPDGYWFGFGFCLYYISDCHFFSPF